MRLGSLFKKPTLTSLAKTVCDERRRSGLLLAVPEEEAQSLLQVLQAAGVKEAVLIGRVQAVGEEPLILEA